jgi:hypothetical protein
VRTGLLIPILEVVLAHLGTRLKCVPHIVSAVEHKIDMVYALRVALAVTRAAEEDRITLPSICKLDFPGIVSDGLERSGVLLTCI